MVNQILLKQKQLIILKKKNKFIETNKLTNKAGEIEHEKIFGQENFLNYLFLSDKRNSILNGSYLITCYFIYSMFKLLNICFI